MSNMSCIQTGRECRPLVERLLKIEAYRETLTLNKFKEIVMEKYYPQSNLDQIEAEFLEFK